MTTKNLDGAYASQTTFRAVMEAFARPGEIRTLHGVAAPPPMAPALAALVQSLMDFETPVWLDPALDSVPAVADWIRFHTGAVVVSKPDKATFALVGNPRAVPDFDAFALGSEEYPDRSTTLIVQIEQFGGRVFTLEGPGLKHARKIFAEPLPDNFARRLAENHELFPRGIDLMLVAGDKVAALPRSIHVTERG